MGSKLDEAPDLVATFHEESHGERFDDSWSNGDQVGGSLERVQRDLLAPSLREVAEDQGTSRS